MKDMKWLWIALAVGLGIALVLFWRKKEEPAPKAAAPMGLLDKEVKELEDIERKVSEMGLKLHTKYEKHGEGALHPTTLQELEKDVEEVLSEIEADLKKTNLTDKERNLLQEFDKRLKALIADLKAKGAAS